VEAQVVTGEGTLEACIQSTKGRQIYQKIIVYRKKHGPKSLHVITQLNNKKGFLKKNNNKKQQD